MTTTPHELFTDDPNVAFAWLYAAVLDACGDLCNDIEWVNDETVIATRTVTYSLTYPRICYDEDGYRYRDTERTAATVAVSVLAWETDEVIAEGLRGEILKIENNWFN